MAWWVVAVRNFSAVAKNSLGGFCVLFRCRMNLGIIPTYVPTTGGAKFHRAKYVGSRE